MKLGNPASASHLSFIFKHGLEYWRAGGEDGSMRFVLLGVHRGHERHIREQRIFHHLLQEPDRRQLRRGDDVTLSGGDERHIRLQLYLAEERDGAARQQVGDVNV